MLYRSTEAKDSVPRIHIILYGYQFRESGADNYTRFMERS